MTSKAADPKKRQREAAKKRANHYDSLASAIRRGDLPELIVGRLALMDACYAQWDAMEEYREADWKAVHEESNKAFKSGHDALDRAVPGYAPRVGEKPPTAPSLAFRHALAMATKMHNIMADVIERERARLRRPRLVPPPERAN